jgi:hypothetical protein
MGVDVLQVGTAVEWKVADGNDTVNCPNTYLCLLRPGSSYCDGVAQ